MKSEDMTQEDWQTYIINRAIHFQTSEGWRQELTDLAIDIAVEESQNMNEEDIDDCWLRSTE